MEASCPTLRRNMASDSSSHFEFKEEKPFDFTFISRDGIKYHATFYPLFDLYPQFPNTYSFSIEPEEETAHPIDLGISQTIAEILRRFFSVHENAMIMVCDSMDGKEEKRKKLFDHWFDKFADETILKYDAAAPLDEYRLYLSIYFRKDNPNRQILLEEFYNLLKNDLYGLAL